MMAKGQSRVAPAPNTEIDPEVARPVTVIQKHHSKGATGEAVVPVTGQRTRWQKCRTVSTVVAGVLVSLLFMLVFIYTLLVIFGVVAFGSTKPIPNGAVQTGLDLSPKAYPDVKRDDFSADHFGLNVTEPYRWLEDPDSKETAAFVADQMKVTEEVLAGCDTRERFKEAMTDLFNFPKISAPFQRGEENETLRWYYSYNTGLQAQSVLYTQLTPEANATILLDPNTLSKDGTVALSGQEWSFDGSLMAYSLSQGGSDWEEIHVMFINKETGEGTVLNDTLKHVKFSSTSWTPDNQGFFYERYPQKDNATDSGKQTGSNLNQEVWYHCVGEPQEQDVLIYSMPEHPDYTLGFGVTEDKQFILITVSTGSQPANQLWYMAMKDLFKDVNNHNKLNWRQYDRREKDPVNLPIRKLVSDFRGSFSVIDTDGPIWLIQTDLNAPRGKVVKVNITNPGEAETWADLLPQHPVDQLSGASVVKGDALLTTYMHDVSDVLQLRSKASGELIRTLPTPGFGSIGELSGRKKMSEIYFGFSSMTEPGSLYKYDTANPNKDPVFVRRVKLPGGYNADDFETKQVFVDSTGGARVPMFIVARKNVTLDGSNPTYLYAYGGYQIVTSPTFSVSRLIFLMGYNGVFALAGIRGGGEYGKTWWEDGRLHKKQHGYDDFINCAQFLHDAKYSSPAKLTIIGGSNGGLMATAVTNQRPDLWAAAISQVGVHDMLRFDQFTIGHAWVTEYGDPSNEEDFRYIYQYSPLHNIRIPQGTHQYPAMLLTTSDHDDRVVPSHSYKMIAQLQRTLAEYPNSPQHNPLLLRVDKDAGHGGGKPTSKVIQEYADSYSFAAAAMNAKWVFPAAPDKKPTLSTAG